ncbi:uncharacterized protein TRUGW13939_08451 [Talaromyces rugulosus]|uniref:Uncharacterized protein n=1 Tax=Talaromyces rugulosus TaxID=121627 RepID=A0A7H8R9B2_TALRU|nr:uncharacterized protein TRUGW13939_08451 [Talaromyces rugulosus]QKX61303.1 hypothetical protein TRUGW13939_08451 [Talaromyces rugulosus]
MCFYFPSSKKHPLDSGAPEPQWRYVRKRAGGRVVSRQIMRGDQVVRFQGGFPRASIPRPVLTTPNRTATGQEGVGEIAIKTENAKTNSKRIASARPSATIKSEKKTGGDVTQKKADAAGVPSWNSWEKDKPSGDWTIHDLYVEKDDAKTIASNENSKSNRPQTFQDKKGGRNGGKQNDKGSGNKRVSSNTKSEKRQGNKSGDNNTTSDWETPENKGDSGNSNESEWAPADANDWLYQGGWELEPNDTNDDEKVEHNTGTWEPWDASPGDKCTEENNSEENDSMQQVPGAWPDTNTENDSEKNNSVNTRKGQAVSKKDKKQENKQQGNPKGLKKPRVKGKGANAIVEFCVCEADNSVSLKSTQEILENCQPGEWQQDEQGNPFFQRAQEESISNTQTWKADTQTSFVDTQSPVGGW